MSGSEHAGPRRHEAALSLTRDGIAILALRPLRGATLPFRLDLLLRIEELVDEMEPLIADGNAKALVIRTGGPRVDLPGYDLDELRLLHGDGIVAWALEAQRVLRRIERLTVPTVAVIREAWLGGAAELALACTHRVAMDVPEATIGFTQTAIGFIPAWGGTVRLPRLIGIRPALELVVGAETLYADEAHEAGLVDELIGEIRFEPQLTAFALAAADDFSARSRRRRPPIHRRLFNSTFPGRRWTARKQRKMLGAEAGRAAQTAFRLITETSGEALDQAFASEAIAAGELIVGEDARGRLHSEKLSERAARRSPTGVAHIENVAIIGTGTTAVDLAQHFLAMDAGVIARGADRPAVRSMEAQIRSGLAWEAEQDRITEAEMLQRGERFRGTTGFGGLGTVQLLVLAPDDPDTAADGLTELEYHLRDGCLILAAGMAGSLSRIQRSFRRPERLLGIQLWSPIDHFPLLEIVPGSLTSPGAADAARRLARRLDLTAVAVGEGSRTPSARLLACYLREATQLAVEGVAIDRIDRLCEAEGMGLGPFRRIDVLGLTTARALLDRAEGSKGGTGSGLIERAMRTASRFYRYRDGRIHRLNPEFAPETPAEIEDGEIWSRIFLGLVNEAATILADEQLSDPRDLDLISIHGLGFPRGRGGLLFHAEEVGLAEIVVRLDGLATQVDPRYRPAGLLRDLALINGSFFGPPRKSSGHSG